MKQFNKEDHKLSLVLSINKLIQYLEPKGIKLIPFMENGCDNTKFYSGEKELIMSNHSLYRYSGRTVFYKETETTMEPFPLTFDSYLNTVIKPIVEYYFKQN